ncbi:aldehyde dehydrogenase family protein [Piscinibacter sp. HJYY11]|uniref:aldehyde dehydrogenase family protein n=1 Tax=Piscinibacter sp. HJYY11 TaxID=2801333 RepID=UPI001F385C1F|nr:aldehyde dehydrogenase family protein [Piscinibacter sp. HJYY11]
MSHPNLKLPPLKQFIDGEWVDSASERTMETIDPATGKAFAQVSAGDAEDVDRAVKSARLAVEHGPWTKVPPAARSRVLNRIADLIEARGEELATLESVDNGKPVTAARMADIPSSAGVFRYMAGWAMRMEGEQIPLANRPQGQFLAYTQRAPIGVVGQIVPWNFPLLMAAWKVAPALAFGCASILKPAEQTPLTAAALVQIAQEAGVPAGQLNLIQGLGHVVGAALVGHNEVNKIAFTGSTEVGKTIVRSGADTLKRISLELGGKSPTIVLADADIDAAVAGAAHAIFFNQGQICTAGSRLYVHESIYDKFIDRLATVAAALKTGPGLDPTTQIGPLVSEEQLRRVAGYVEIGKKEGAGVAVGGDAVGGPGYFYRPTILTHVNQKMRVVQEEIFGPVLVATRFKEIDEVVAMANDSVYGLAASVWTRDVSKAHAVARALHAGTVWVNCHHVMDPAMPFGGYKQSGWGREMGAAAYEMYTESKSVCIQL